MMFSLSLTRIEKNVFSNSSFYSCQSKYLFSFRSRSLQEMITEASLTLGNSSFLTALKMSPIWFMIEGSCLTLVVVGFASAAEVGSIFMSEDS